MMYLLITYRPADGGRVLILREDRLTYGDALTITAGALLAGDEYAIIAQSRDDGKTLHPFVATMDAKLDADETVQSALEIAHIMLVLRAADGPIRSPYRDNLN